MAQRLVTALALAAVPSLLIADEPTTGLDRPLVDHTLDLLRWTVDAAASAGSTNSGTQRTVRRAVTGRCRPGALGRFDGARSVMMTSWKTGSMT